MMFLEQLTVFAETTSKNGPRGEFDPAFNMRYSTRAAVRIRVNVS